MIIHYIKIKSLSFELNKIEENASIKYNDGFN